RSRRRPWRTGESTLSTSCAPPSRRSAERDSELPVAPTLEQRSVAEHLDLSDRHTPPHHQQEIARGAARGNVALGVLVHDVDAAGSQAHEPLALAVGAMQ